MKKSSGSQTIKGYMESYAPRLRTTRKSPQLLVDRTIKSLQKLQLECKKDNPVYLSESSRKKLQIALAFSFSKSSKKDIEVVKELMFHLGQNDDTLLPGHLTHMLNVFLEFIKQGRENYEWEEIHYLMKYLSPLLFQEN